MLTRVKLDLISSFHPPLDAFIIIIIIAFLFMQVGVIWAFLSETQIVIFVRTHVLEIYQLINVPCVSHISVSITLSTSHNLV